MCAMPRAKPDISPHIHGQWIKCGVGASELLQAGNGTAPQPNSSAWQPTSLYFNPEEAALDTKRDYALVLQGGCAADGCSSAAADHRTEYMTIHSVLIPIELSTCVYATSYLHSFVAPKKLRRGGLGGGFTPQTIMAGRSARLASPRSRASLRTKSG